MTKYSPAPAYSQDESKLGRCAVETPGPSVDAFACNQTRLLLAVFGYQIMHAQRAVLERATGTGWSLRRLLERVASMQEMPMTSFECGCVEVAGDRTVRDGLEAGS